MPALLFGAVLAAVAAALLLFSRKGEAANVETKTETVVQAPTLRALFAKHGAAYGVDPLLLEAIAMVESSLRPDAVRWNPPHDVSVGVMQILAVPPEGTQRGEDFMPTNRFDISPWPVSFAALKNPDLNIALGAQILRWNLRTFGFPRGVAVYNSWSARHAQESGPFPNDAYVSKVLHNLENLRKEMQ
jgi:soluble lytic murein transglycosylase-like protein